MATISKWPPMLSPRTAGVARFAEIERHRTCPCGFLESIDADTTVGVNVTNDFVEVTMSHD